MDVEGRKLSLGHKQTQTNPWDAYSTEFGEGTVHTAEIGEIVDKGATITLNDDIVAFIPSRHLEKEDNSRLKKGEEAQFKIIEFNKDFKRVVASHTATFKEQEERNLKAAKRRQEAQAEESKTTFGDANAQLQALKDKMEKEGNN